MRSEKLSEIYRASGADVVYVTTDYLLRYLTGFYATDGAVLLDGERCRLIVDARYFEGAEKALWGTDITVVLRSAADTPESLLKDYKKVAIPFALTSYPEYAALKGKFNVRLSNVNNEYNAAYYPLTALQTITLYIPSLLGAPIAEQNCSVELEVEIQNNHQEVVASYTEVGQGSAKVAAYYGYTGEEASRYCTIQAIQSAMDKVKLNIAEDYARINKALQK